MLCKVLKQKEEKNMTGKFVQLDGKVSMGAHVMS